MNHPMRWPWMALLAASLGYCVDLYDIVIFGVVRVRSLQELGLAGADNTAWGMHLLNLQMAGLLLGGFFWGRIADQYGRRTALLATIAVYSLANLANAGVTSVTQYAVLRFVAGFGLAGELGAGVALISELLPRDKRGYGTTLIATLGLVGALLASLFGHLLPWRAAFALGGGMGFAVLALRWFTVPESPLHRPAPMPWAALGKALPRALALLLLGAPIWFASAVFVNLAPELAKASGYGLTVAEALRWQATGLALGCAITGIASEALQSRRAVLLPCLLLLGVASLGLLGSTGPGPYLGWIAVLGLAQGYWTLFATCCAEHFPTALRGLMTGSLPNLVRAVTIPVNLAIQALHPHWGLGTAAMMVGATLLVLALIALWRLPETWGRNLS